ncbi:unnamed protein product [Timema podura]|uniref:Cilia- and flagella-associated protein 263 n=1 Tax=Timema podura TaxID=61482 RepID=A0ABN7P3Q0_TIMPD|nr:unnamed protein product [Timema podura]
MDPSSTPRLTDRPSERSFFNVHFQASAFSSLEVDPEELGDEQLLKQIEDMRNANNVMKLENEIFERYLKIVEPSTLKGLDKQLDQAHASTRARHRLRSIVSAVMSFPLDFTAISSYDRLARKGTSFPMTNQMSSSKMMLPSLTETPFKINLAVKTDIVTKICIDIKELTVNLQVRNKKSRASLKAQIEQLSTQLKIRSTVPYRTSLKHAAEFEESVVKGGADPITGKVKDDKYIRFMDNWIKKCDRELGIMRLSKSTLARELTRLDVHLAFVEEMGRQLHAIDFDIQKIESEQSLRRIDHQDVKIREMKLLTAQCSKKLSRHNSCMYQSLVDRRKIEDELTGQEVRIERMKEEIEKVEGQARKAREKYEGIKHLKETYTVPDVVDYVKKIAELNDLKRGVSIWKRRKQVQDVAFMGIRRDLKIQIQSAPSWVQAKYEQLASGDSTQILNLDKRGNLKLFFDDNNSDRTIKEEEEYLL